MTVRGSHRRRALAAIALCASLGWPAARAAVPLDPAGKIKLLGDFTLRLVGDWDSQDAMEVPRDDRNRARVRGRLGLEFTPQSWITFGARIQTGREGNQRSAFSTILSSDNAGSEELDVFANRYYVAAQSGRVWGWAGRNSFTFWKQNELFWDDDATLAGGTAGWRHAWGSHKFEAAGGYYTLPDGMTHFIANMAAGQVVYDRSQDADGFTVAAGFYSFFGEHGALFLLDGNGARDYRIGVVSGQWRLAAGRIPLSLGADWMRNFKDYSDTDPDLFTAAHHDETDGWAVTATAGRLKQKGDWLGSWTWTRIEALAVNASFGQDDYFRWGNPDQTTSSDYEGHELRGGWKPHDAVTILGRLYRAESITTPEDGKRFRLDFIYEF